MTATAIGAAVPTTGRWARAVVTDRSRPEHARRVVWVRRGVTAFAVIMLTYLVLPVATTLEFLPDQPHLPLLVAAAAVFGLCHLLIVRLHPAGWQRSLQGVALAAQAVLTVLVPLAGGVAWLGLGAYLLGSLGIVLRPRHAAPLIALSAAALVALMLLMQVDGTEILLLTLQNVITGLCIAGGVRVGTLTVDLLAARDEAAVLAVDNERLRFARDLHDVLGHNLSAISLKAELTARLLAVKPEAAGAELDTIREIAARSLTDVRAVAKGYRSLDLTREAASLTSVLRSAGVQVAELGVPADLAQPVSDVLAWALREGVTNVLRHASATRVELLCRREDHEVVLELRNDGVGASPPKTDAVGGNGIAGLTERVAALGGRLATSSPRAGWFSLTLRIPETTARISGGNDPEFRESGESNSVVPVLGSTGRG